MNGRRLGLGALAGLCLFAAMCQRRWTQLSHLGEVLTPVRAEAGNAPRFPARARRCRVHLRDREQQRPAPGPAGVKRPPRGGTGAGRGLWPPAGLGATFRAEGAMAPANKTAREVPRCDLSPPLRAGSGNAPRFPRPCTTPTTGPFHQAQRRPAPVPAGVKRPPWAGRALAGGFGPRPACGTRTAWPGRWPRPIRNVCAEQFSVFQPGANAFDTFLQPVKSGRKHQFPVPCGKPLS